MSLSTGIAFDGSYVLGISIKPYVFLLTTDFLLTPEHPCYVPPHQGERGCFHRGWLRVDQFSRVHWHATGFPPATDANDEVDFGNIDEISHEGTILRLTGEWGEVEVEGGEVQIGLDEPA